MLGEEIEDNDELLELDEKFNARFKLWSNIDKFKRQKEMWLEKNFDELDTQMIGNDMKKYLFEVGTLKSDVKLLNEAEKDEVLELFIVEYRSIE